MRELARDNDDDALPGGLLEATGRLFKRSVRMDVYRTRLPGTEEVPTAETAPVPAPRHRFRDLLVETGHIVPSGDDKAEDLETSTADVLARLQAGDAGWERLVPLVVAEAIKARGLLGWRPAAPAARGG
jgi:hypothetical protein